ncbi:hypothetical protein DYB38_009191 [Aphanomyces astaci]|uniref:Protein kinase domain-containing protein n=1 Tax=Aphanomyces astaci TaxID=112090 RepID=A0A397C4W0_APHAT|nr:hypothetical protein DYB38_009191 [Aphanomyces astaci]
MSIIIKKVTDFYKKDECVKYYKFGKTLGTGSFATVKSAVNKADNTKWAVKCIEKASLAPDDEEALRVEVEVLQMVEHPNIVKLKEVFDCPKTFYMVMEEMSGGELFDRIVEKEKYSEREARTVVHKLATALAYCHTLGIVHRDLKVRHCKLNLKACLENAEIKIADFGLAKLIQGNSMMQTACGTPGYVAPEILEGKPYGGEVDMWSLGVITYILLCGFPPFYDENNAALFATIKAGAYDFPSPYWDHVSDSGASDKQLPSFTTEMRRYNARRRFRAGIMAAKAIRGMSLLHKKGDDGAADGGVLGATSPVGRSGRGTAAAGGENVQVGHARRG